MLRVAIAGGNGRMGQTLIGLVNDSESLELAAVTLAPEETVPEQAPAAANLYFHDVEAALAKADVLIDFTTPRRHRLWCTPRHEPCTPAVL